jgi:translation initiation factor 1 (eIF-1/SUI1)
MKIKVATDGGGAFGSTPFASLDLGPLPEKPIGTLPGAPAQTPKPAKRGTVHLRIEKSGRGGKTVTVLFGPGVEALGADERAALLRSLKAALGTGGTQGADAGTLEVQGDERPRVAAWLRKAGFACKG